ncbi:MAG TPA: 3-hydroxyacyl-CoA dehydrogenase NAD-binding domain-containing protein [Chitinophagaceae bacterium]|nr:3-hydroxyacyl-CoA dehydrogenase NAD-binding domain-containing protein [Chitinophagaceae bacterium]
MTIQTICVCGAGTMGSGIAQVAAQNGFHALLFDVNPAVLEKAKASLAHNLQSLADKGRLPAAELPAVLGRISFVSDINDCIADLIIEAIVEIADAKAGLFNQLAEVNHSETIFATNTSSLSVASIAAKVVHPERVAGMHFFNPAPVMKLVEIVRAPQTGEAVVQALYDLALQMGKTPVHCKDAPGFIVNHVARPYYLEALRLVEQGLSDADTIDAVLESAGFKMGPFRLMDLIGNDVNYAVSCSVYEALGKPARLQPSFIQKERVDKGELGLKSGRGYYQY